MKNPVVRTGANETGWGIQADVEEINPQQLFARDLLVEKVGIPYDGATVCVKKIGARASSALELLLQRSRDPARDFGNFMESFLRVVH